MPPCMRVVIMMPIIRGLLHAEAAKSLHNHGNDYFNLF